MPPPAPLCERCRDDEGRREAEDVEPAEEGRGGAPLPLVALLLLPADQVRRSAPSTPVLLAFDDGSWLFDCFSGMGSSENVVCLVAAVGGLEV